MQSLFLAAVTGFPIMAALAQRLPVVLIPEQLLIAPVRNHMVDHRCLCEHAVLHALIAQRVALQESRAGLSPAAVVATGLRAAAHSIG